MLLEPKTLLEITRAIPDKVCRKIRWKMKKLRKINTPYFSISSSLDTLSVNSSRATMINGRPQDSKDVSCCAMMNPRSCPC